jgi:hypothetical protein
MRLSFQLPHKYKIRGLQSRPACAKKQDPISKISGVKMAEGMAQAVEHLRNSQFKPQYCQKEQNRKTSQEW